MTSNNVPNLRAALTGKDGRISTPWNSFFQQFSQKASSAADVEVDASPFSYTPNKLGNVVITGGTVSAVALVRGNVTVALAPTTQFVPVAIGDTVTVTYSVLPVVRFLGSY